MTKFNFLGHLINQLYKFNTRKMYRLQNITVTNISHVISANEYQNAPTLLRSCHWYNTYWEPDIF